MTCYYCSSKNVVVAYQTIGHRNMCEKCAKSKQPLVKGSLKLNKKRVIKDSKIKAQKKRKVRVKESKVKVIKKEIIVTKVKSEFKADEVEFEDESSKSSEEEIAYEPNSTSDTETEENKSLEE